LQKFLKLSTLLSSCIAVFYKKIMNIFKNKYFLLGNLAFLLVAIPVALYFVKNQTATRSSAAPTTTLSFNPPSIETDQCTDTTQTNLVLDPGQNIVSTVVLSLTWDKSKFDVEFTPNSTAFPQVLKGPTPTDTGMTITVNIGSDVTKAITTSTTVGTLTIKPLAPTGGSSVDLSIDPTNTKVYSLSQQDGATENVYNPAGSSPLKVTIDPKVCDATSPTPSVSPMVTDTPEVTNTPKVTSGVTATLTPPLPPTQASTGNLPVCLSLTASPSSGYSPLTVSFTAGGQSSTGTITQANFDFGDGSGSQAVTTGMGTASVSAQTSHIYNAGGNFNALVTFTDNSGSVSASCTQQIAVGGPVSPTATLVPTSSAGGGAVATATPTIANPGSVGTTLGIIGGVVVVILGGLFLLAL
jgi:hypothetical protein